MSLHSSTLFSLQILNPTVRYSLLITRKFSVSQRSQFTSKIIFRKKKKQNTVPAFSSFFTPIIFLPFIVEHFYLQHNLYFNILYSNNSTSSSEDKKDQLDSCNSHDWIISFSHMFPNFSFQFLLHGGKNMNDFPLYWKSSGTIFFFCLRCGLGLLRWSQLWSHNSGIKAFEDTVICLFPHRAFVEKRFFFIFIFISIQMML